MADPKKTVGVLFADIADSSYLYKSLGDEGAKDVVLNCLKRVASAVETHGGKVIDRIGDELMCTFPTIDATAAAAVDMQEAVEQARQSGSLPSRMSVRIGFHFGPVVVSEESIFGDTVYTAKRIATIAKSQQIMTTGKALQSLDPQWSQLLRFVCRTGVKGKREVYDVYELVWDPRFVTRSEAFSPRTPPPESKLVLQYHGREISLDETRPLFMIGRSVSCDLVVDDQGVSRFHARIEYSRGRFTLVDLSTNGTLVENGRGEVIHLHHDEYRLTGKGQIRVGTTPRVQEKHAIQYEHLLPDFREV